LAGGARRRPRSQGTVRPRPVRRPRGGPVSFRDPNAARAGGYVLLVATMLVAIGLVFHPVPAGGFEERPSVLASTPWWGPIHIAIAAGFVLVVLGGLLLLVAGGSLTK